MAGHCKHNMKFVSTPPGPVNYDFGKNWETEVVPCAGACLRGYEN
jgi:hypothetical protein